MSHSKGKHEEVKSPQQKIGQLMQQKRKEQIEGKFSSMRKKMTMARSQQEFIQQAEKQRGLINQQIKAIMQADPSNTFELVQMLWSHCGIYNFRYFSDSNVKDLLRHLQMLMRRDVWSVDNQNEMMMVVWLISNWTQGCLRPKDFTVGLIDLFVVLLQRDISPKLNHLILYTMINLCRHNIDRIHMMQIGLIGKAMCCRIYQRKQADISTLLMNIIYELPFNFIVSQRNLQNVIYFLSINLEKSKTDELMREDSILMIKKLLSINDYIYHKQVILRLTPNILFFISCLQDEKNLQNCLEIFELLTQVYTKIDYTEQMSYLFSEITLATVLKLIEQFWQENQGVVVQVVNNKLQRQLWLLRTCLFKIQNSVSISLALEDLFTKCKNNQIKSYEEYAIAIIAQNCDGYQIFNFCINKLEQNMENEDLRLTLLLSIERLLKKEQHPEQILRSNMELSQVLRKVQLEFLTIADIMKITKRIYKLDPNYIDPYEVKLMSFLSEEEPVTGSFVHISEVLLSPQIKVNSHDKQATGLKNIKDFMQAEQV